MYFKVANKFSNVNDFGGLCDSTSTILLISESAKVRVLIILADSDVKNCLQKLWHEH